MERIHDKGIPAADGKTVLHPQIIRIGRPGYIPDKTVLNEYMLHNKVKTYKRDRPGVVEQGEEEMSNLYASRAVGNEAFLYFCTAATCTSRAFTNLRPKISALVIDEATRSTEPDIVGAVLAGVQHKDSTTTTRTRGAHVILIGDHRQNSALSLGIDLFNQVVDVIGEGRRKHNPSGSRELQIEEQLLGCSCFEHLHAEREVVSHMFMTQYRMSPGISAIHSIVFYDGLVKDGRAAKEFEKGYVQTLGNYRTLCWIDTSKATDKRDDVSSRLEADERGAHINDYEQKVMVQVLYNLRLFHEYKGFEEKEWPSVSVITPYRAQRQKLEREQEPGRQRIYPHIKFLTVDSMQHCISNITVSNKKI